MKKTQCDGPILIPVVIPSLMGAKGVSSSHFRPSELQEKAHFYEFIVNDTSAFPDYKITTCSITTTKSEKNMNIMC